LEKEWTGLLLEDATILRPLYTVTFLCLYNKKVRTCFAGQVRFDPRADRWICGKCLATQ
jgi:ribosomal protein S27AE